MLTPAEFLRDIEIHPHFQSRIVDWLKPWRLKSCVDILIVVDVEISTTPSNSFGIASVIELLRSTTVGCMKFRVDIALRSNEAFSVVANPGPTQPKYRGFRFNSATGGADVIDRYEQIWCFGFKPNNSGSADDSQIDAAGALPASNPELNKLDQWMKDRKGGLFGTGDHHFLGASMCRRIPRLGTMRRWTNADGVPPIGGINRIDTLRPPPPVTSFQAGGPAFLSNGAHQGDLTVQPIRWVAWKSVYWPFAGKRKRPHPVLCHPTLGPIDVMPDHAHEGLCVPNPNLSANKKFRNEPEYPNATDGGPKPQPQIIAYGSNLDSDDWNFAKGAQPGRSNNPMIAVYDGHRAGVGRVATDSTWHHWMDVNINALRAANNDDWKKISRYFINLALWLNPPGFSTRCLYLSVVASHFESVGFQEYHPGASTAELGRALRLHLGKVYGPCWVTERIWELAHELRQIPQRHLMELGKRFEGSDIDEEDFEDLVLGRMVEATLKPADLVKGADPGSIKALAVPEKLFARPFAAAMADFTKETERRLKLQSGVVRGLRPVRG
ncbi:MAG: hypothetical protein EP306_06230 [Burkholderiales bacterium]|nr:MAG: hypothetical protein EP306_06230 [Burkholderiales bacterium]